MFMVSDDPDLEGDREVVRHQIESRRVSGKEARDEELTEDEKDRQTPTIDLEVLRAYIAYARENHRPIIEDEAVEERIEKFFVGLRSQSYDEDAPIPITYRQNEGIMRLAEASARARLSDEVALEDAERAITLVRKSMEQIGFDPDTGELDADIIETGQSMSQKRRREGILEFLEELDPPVSTEEIVEEFDVDRNTIERDLDHLSRRKGFIYGTTGEGDWRMA